MSTLSIKRKLLVEAYAGDIIEAMRIAGYTGTADQLRINGEKLLEDPLIIEAIKLRCQLQNKTRKIIADREDRQTFWTQVMYNNDANAKPEVGKDGVSKVPGNIPLVTRLKASEMLGKSEADFMDRLDLTGTVTINEIIQQSIEIPEEDIKHLEEEALAKLAAKKAARQKQLIAPSKDETIVDAEIIPSPVTVEDLV